MWAQHKTVQQVQALHGKQNTHTLPFYRKHNGASLPRCEEHILGLAFWRAVVIVDATRSIFLSKAQAAATATPAAATATTLFIALVI